MEVSRDEACALKTARALSYIDFRDLDRWYGEFGFLKIFHSLKEEGSDLAWALMVGAINRGIAGDGQLPKDIFARMLRENRVTLQHLSELYPESAPVRVQGGAFRIKALDLIPDEAVPRIRAALKRFSGGEWDLRQLKDELYRVHTTDMRDSLYFHTLLAARSVSHPISAHMLEKALHLVPAGHLPLSEMSGAFTRLECLQKEHLISTVNWEKVRNNKNIEEFATTNHQARPVDGRPQQEAPGNIAGGPVPPTPPPMGNGNSGYRATAAAFLRKHGVPEYGGSTRLSDLVGFDEGRLSQLLEPFLLRCYAADNELGDDGGFILAVGPAEVDKASMLTAIARGLSLSFQTVTYREFASEWLGETEHNLMRVINDARSISRKNHGRPFVLIFDDGPGATGGNGPRKPTSHDIMMILGSLITGPRRKEVLGEQGQGNVIIVATTVQSAGMEPGIRVKADVIHFEPPTTAGLRNLLIQNTVGRYYVCDLEHISFDNLAEEARGLGPRSISRASQRAKLIALRRKANEMGLSLTSSSEKARNRIKDGYCIMEDDLLEVIREEKLTCRTRPPPMPTPRKTARSRRNQTPLYKWTQGAQEAGEERPIGEGGD